MTVIPTTTSSSSGSSSSNHPSSSAVNNRNLLSTQTSSSAAAVVASPAVSSNQRPKSVSQWSVVDVQKWFRRNCGDYYHLYSEKFLEQDITGRSLVRLSENSLLRLGIVHPDHRQAIWREIAKLRLRTNILLLKDLERKLEQESEQH